MVVALKPLHDRARIKRVVVSTYQSVSGAGKEGMDELWDQTKSIYNPVTDVPPTKFTKPYVNSTDTLIEIKFLEESQPKRKSHT